MSWRKPPLESAKPGGESQRRNPRGNFSEPAVKQVQPPTKVAEDSTKKNIPGDSIRHQTSSPFSLGWSRFFNHFKFGSLKFTLAPKKGHQHFERSSLPGSSPPWDPGIGRLFRMSVYSLLVATFDLQIQVSDLQRIVRQGPKQQGNHLVKPTKPRHKSDSVWDFRPALS